jgi:uncharacterized protein YydD (DUF2326 family)
MRLIRIEANKPSFKTVEFNPRGLSLIVAKQKSASESKTYNGVGKSLLMTLVHFCLGSQKIDAFSEHLKGWEFILTIEIAGEKYRIRRGTDEQDKLYLGDEKLSLVKLKEKLERELFEIDTPIPNLTYRSLIGRFLRHRKDAYATFDHASDKEKPYAALVCNGFLLGLDTNLIEEKYRLKTELDRIEEFRKNLMKDPVVIEFFVGDKNADIELQYLDDKIQAIGKDLQNFEIAEDYYDLVREANDIQRKLQDARNEATIFSNAVDNIDEGLASSPDLGLESVREIYSEAQAHFSDAVVKQLEEVTQFHQKLLSNRISRLKKERTKYLHQKEEQERLVSKLGEELNKRMKYLDSHRALDEFVAMTNTLSELKSKAEKIRNYRDLLNQYDIQIQQNKVSLLQSNQVATEYITDSAFEIAKAQSTFRSFSRKLYPDVPSGLVITNNVGENQIRFDIDARIQNDSSDGINEAKIFCYDMTILTLKNHHRVDCVFHDSRLFSDVDPRQVRVMMQSANDTASMLNLQYIASINQSTLDAIQMHSSEDEFKRVCTDNTVLTLGDDNPEDKLLGIQVDMKY